MMYALAASVSGESFIRSSSEKDASMKQQQCRPCITHTSHEFQRNDVAVGNHHHRPQKQHQYHAAEEDLWSNNADSSKSDLPLRDSTLPETETITLICDDGDILKDNSNKNYTFDSLWISSRCCKDNNQFCRQEQWRRNDGDAASTPGREEDGTKGSESKSYQYQDEDDHTMSGLSFDSAFLFSKSEHRQQRNHTVILPNNIHGQDSSESGNEISFFDVDGSSLDLLYLHGRTPPSPPPDHYQHNKYELQTYPSIIIDNVPSNKTYCMEAATIPSKTYPLTSIDNQAPKEKKGVLPRRVRMKSPPMLMMRPTLCLDTKVLKVESSLGHATDHTAGISTRIILSPNSSTTTTRSNTYIDRRCLRLAVRNDDDDDKDIDFIPSTTATPVWHVGSNTTATFMYNNIVYGDDDVYQRTSSSNCSSSNSNSSRISYSLEELFQSPSDSTNNDDVNMTEDPIQPTNETDAASKASPNTLNCRTTLAGKLFTFLPKFLGLQNEMVRRRRIENHCTGRIILSSGTRFVQED
jgi:hypothetical protein